VFVDSSGCRTSRGSTAVFRIILHIPRQFKKLPLLAG
jgi:hypothetical protein